MALQQGYDDLIWIDTDIEWQPEWFFKLLEYPVDVVGGTYRKKGDREEYVFSGFGKKDPDTGLIEVNGLGTGFLRMSRAAMQYLWDSNQSYIDNKDDTERRMIFDIIIKDRDLVSEEIYALRKLIDGGFKIWLDPSMTCNHTGPYKFIGSFQNWVDRGMPKNNVTAPNISPTSDLQSPRPAKIVPKAPRQL